MSGGRLTGAHHANMKYIDMTAAEVVESAEELLSVAQGPQTQGDGRSAMLQEAQTLLLLAIAERLERLNRSSQDVDLNHEIDAVRHVHGMG